MTHPTTRLFSFPPESCSFIVHCQQTSAEGMFVPGWARGGITAGAEHVPQQEHSAFGEFSCRDLPSKLRVLCVVSCRSGLPPLPLADLEGGDTGYDHPSELSL